MFTNGTDVNTQHPTIQFNTSGYYEITLLASDGVSSNTEVKANFIQVLPQNGGLPFYEGFESYTDLSSTENWLTYNLGNNEEFDIVNGVGHTGNQCVKLSNYGQFGSNKDELISSQVDLSGLLSTDNITLSFRYAYRKRFASDDEWLKVFISNNCADTWVQRKTLHGDALSEIVSSNSWTPSAQNEWITVHMTNVTSSYFVQNFRYKFEFDGEGGNNFFLDDINIYLGAPSENLVIGIEEVESTIGGFSIYPNPVDEELNIEFSVTATVISEITISDITGKITQTSIVLANEGNNLVFMNTSDLSAGVYFVKINAGGVEHVAQFIVR